MTINEAYLVALRATITVTYVPVMTPGLYDTFPAHPETFPGHIGWFPGLYIICPSHGCQKGFYRFARKVLYKCPPYATLPESFM